MILKSSGHIAFHAASSESARIDAAGRLLIGSTASNQVWGLQGALQVEGTTASTATAALISNQNSNAPFYLAFCKSRGTSDGSATIVQDGDYLGTISFTGADGTDRENTSGRIDCVVDGTPGSNDTPGRLMFSTTADGSGGVTERMRINSAGNVGINDTDPSYRLNVAGDNSASNGTGMLKGIIGVQNNTTAFGSSPTAGISFQTKYRSSPDVPLDVAAIYGGKENTSDADKDGYLGFAVREEGGSGTYEKMRLTSSGGLQLNGYNYIESCELRIHANGSIQSVNDAIKFATRFNTDSSLISINHSGGTGSGSRITFTKAVYVLVTVSQDVLGSQDTSYWSQKLVTNGGIQGYHLVRASSQWDQMAWSEGVSIPANGWLEIQWNGTNGMTNVDGTSWSHYHFLVWQNV